MIKESKAAMSTDTETQTPTGTHRIETLPEVVPVFENGWKPGDPCGACGSTRTGWDVVLGGVCGGCGATDSDE